MSFLFYAYINCALIFFLQKQNENKLSFFHLHAYMHTCIRPIKFKKTDHRLSKILVNLSRLKVARRPRPKPTRLYNTRAVEKRRMDALEQENAELRGEVTTLKADLERLNAMVESLVAARNQPPPPQPSQVTPTEPVMPTSAAPISTLQYTMPEGYPWGMPFLYNVGGQQNVSQIPTPIMQNTTTAPQLGTTLPQVTVVVPQPTVAIPTPVLDEPIYHAEPAESMGHGSIQSLG
jgi:hypothetical protein